ncbi:MAG: PAS domain S-box protein, partial [Kosmotoga sp.]
NNKNYTMEFISQGAKELTGYKIEEMLYDKNKSYGQIIHPDDRKKVWETVQKSFKKSEQYEQTYRIITRNGNIKWVWERGRGILNKQNKIEFLEGIISDVTKRVQAEKSLKKEKNLIKQIMETSPVAITNVDKNGNIKYANSAAEKLFGLTKNKISEHTYNDRNWKITDFQKKPFPKSKLPFNIVKKTLEPVYNINHTIKTEAKERKYLSISASPIMDENNNFNGMVAVIKDITEKYKTEKEKKKLRRENLRLQKTDALGTLAGGIAHDFNNLLFAMLGNIDLALSNDKIEKINEYLNKAKKSGKEAKDLIKQILTFSREQNINRKHIDITTVIKKTINLLRNILPSNIKLEENITDEKLSVYSNPSSINQIIMNLGTNAYQAMEKTGGKIIIKLEKKVFNKGNNLDFKKGKYAKLQIKDTGSGIEANKLDKIFDPFYTTKSDSEGTGLGLSTVEGIVKNLDGRIRVNSEIGIGSEFTIFLPLSAKDKIYTKENVDTYESEMKEYKIIYVDDNNSLTELISDTLERMGCSVTVFNKPKKALNFILNNDNSFDAFLFDQTMPELTGEELTVKIRNRGIDTPIFILTGYSKLFDRKKAEEIGVSGFFYKPIEIKKLYQKIHAVLNK